jgi:FkbM family methyltransferase
MTRRVFGRRFAANLLRFAIGVFAVLVIPVLAIFALAPHSQVAQTAAISIVGTVNFAASLPGRHYRCSIADVWAANFGNLGPIKERIRTASKVAGTDGNLTAVSTPAGRFWIPASDLNALAEELAEEELDVYGHDVRAGDVVLDCGANVGVYTRAVLAKGARIVVAIEPNPTALVCLRRNFEHEIREGRVIVYPKGVWDKDATLRLTTNPKLASTANSVALDRGEQGPEVPLTTIDKLVAELKLASVDFIKMDIEGAESRALTGAAQVLAAYRPRLAISMEHKRSDPDEIPPLVRRLNPRYEIQWGACRRTTGRVQPEVLFAR